MAISYGNEIVNSGSSVGKRGFRVYADYAVTQTETSWYVNVRLGVQQVTGGSMSWASGRLYWSISGGGISTGTIGGSAVSLSDNQSKLLTGYYKSTTYNRTTSAQSVSITCNLTGKHPSSWHGTSTVTLTFAIPARTSYRVSYNGNGATGGSTASQTKYYGYNLTVNSNGFTKTGYSFVRWNTAANGTGTNYAAGSAYSANAAVTLYAQWTKNQYTIVYNANGGSGTMANDVFYYDTDYTLKANAFTREDYLFLGWATSATGSVQYADKAAVRNLAASGTVNLYAVWRYRYSEPDLQNPSAYRTSSNVEDDAGTGAMVSVHVTPALYEASIGSSAYITTTVAAYYKLSTDSTYTQLGSAKTTSKVQTLSWQAADSTFSEEQQYDIMFVAQVVVSSKVKTSSNVSTFISTASFLVDMSPTDNSIGIFTSAPADDSVVLIGKGGDIVLELDDNAASGVDYELLEALRALGWITTT